MNEGAAGGADGLVDGAEEKLRHVEDDGRPVEDVELRAEEGAAQEPEITADDLDFIPEGVRGKAVGRVTELAERLHELCGETPQEIEAQRSFTQSLGGKFKGWRVTFEVKAIVRRETV